VTSSFHLYNTARFLVGAKFSVTGQIYTELLSIKSVLGKALTKPLAISVNEKQNPQIFADV